VKAAHQLYSQRLDNLIMPKVDINTPAPDFEIADTNGKSFKLSDQHGKNVLLVFNRGFV
jgi:peroxiredoxin